jgi:hypothetical protein
MGSIFSTADITSLMKENGIASIRQSRNAKICED